MCCNEHTGLWIKLTSFPPNRRIKPPIRTDKQDRLLLSALLQVHLGTDSALMPSVGEQRPVEKLHGRPILNLAKLCHQLTPEPSSGQAAQKWEGMRCGAGSSELCPGAEITSCVTLCDTSIYDIPRRIVNDSGYLENR